MDAKSETEKPATLDSHWGWSTLSDGKASDVVTGDFWRIHWRRSDERQRHIRLSGIDGLRSRVFPYDVIEVDELAIQVAATGARPLSSMAWQQFSPPSMAGLFENLGRWLRGLHDLPAPAGFGDPHGPEPFQTINAFMAAEYLEFGHRISTFDDDHLYEKAVESLATLRHELSIFHPHGKSCWTVGRLTPERIAIDPDTLQVEAILDLGACALRPPDYDLAALRVYGILTDHPIADRAFWRGYQAAQTSDLARRLSYFERLIELERLLDCPAYLCSGSDHLPGLGT